MCLFNHDLRILLAVLKSWAPQGACGFDSRPRHQRSPRRTSLCGHSASPETPSKSRRNAQTAPATSRQELERHLRNPHCECGARKRRVAHDTRRQGDKVSPDASRSRFSTGTPQEFQFLSQGGPILPIFLAFSHLFCEEPARDFHQVTGKGEKGQPKKVKPRPEASPNPPSNRPPSVHPDAAHRSE